MAGMREIRQSLYGDRIKSLLAHNMENIESVPPTGFQIVFARLEKYDITQRWRP
jgi:hypothetical protein